MDVIVKNYENYIEKFKTENTKTAAISLINKMDRYIKGDLEYIKKISPEEIDLFMIAECTGKSETTISNVISRVKDLCVFFGNKEASSHLTLSYVKEKTHFKETKLLSPAEIQKAIESLVNFQDKVLLLFTYIGLYDNDFETIRHLRKDQFKPNHTLELDNGEVIKFNKYCADIVYGAIKEETNEKNVVSEGRETKPYLLNNDTPYIIKTKLRKGGADIVPAATLKKRFTQIAKVAEDNRIIPVNVKNSKFIYDLVKLEYEQNFGMDINQLELKQYCKDNEMKGTIEKLNMSKKEMKTQILEEIVKKQIFFENGYGEE